MRRAGLARVVATGGCALLLAACGGSSTPKQASGSGQAATAPAASTAASASAGTPVRVTETEYTIALSQRSFPAGTYTFVIDDKGHATHALEIDGPGVKDRASTSIDGGESTSLTVTLQRGTYRVYCPIGTHASLGMDTTITVS